LSLLAFGCPTTVGVINKKEMKPEFKYVIA